MERLKDIQEYLWFIVKKFDYPLIHSMNPDEISDIFHVSNRCFLINWTLTLLDADYYGKILKGPEKDKYLLAQLVYCHGFCTDKQKMGLFDGTISSEEQLEILYRIFHSVEQQIQASKLIDIEPVSMEEIEKLRTKDINILCVFGDIKILTENERNNLLETNKPRTRKLHLEQPKIIKTQKDVIKPLGIKDIVSDINENLRQFDRVVKAISKETSSEFEPNYKLNPKSEEILESCNEYLKMVTQYVADLRTVRSFTVKDIQLPIDEVSSLIQMLAERIQKFDLGLSGVL